MNKAMTSETGLRGTTAAWAAKILNRDLIQLEVKLALHPSRMLGQRVAAVRAELSELEAAARR